MQTKTDDELRAAGVAESLIDTRSRLNTGIAEGRKFFHPQSGMIVEITQAAVYNFREHFDVYVLDAAGNTYEIHGGYFSRGSRPD